MTRQNKRKHLRLRNQAVLGSNPNTMLDRLLTLDRSVLELAMHIYNVPAGERFAMREHNQRLHEAVREYLPRRAQFSRSVSALQDHAE
jgi:hypothetical protein